MPQAKRELLKSAEVCELVQLQPYVLRSWEAEFPGLGKPAASGSGRIYQPPDIDLVLRIKELVFAEGLTLAGARRRLEEEHQESMPLLAPELGDGGLNEGMRDRLREVRRGLELILQMVSRAPTAAELTLVSPAQPGKMSASKRRRAG